MLVDDLINYTCQKNLFLFLNAYLETYRVYIIYKEIEDAGFKHHRVSNYGIIKLLV